MHAGPRESLLMQTLTGDPFAMGEEEKRTIADNYLSPCFKVGLGSGFVRRVGSGGGGAGERGGAVSYEGQWG